MAKFSEVLAKKAIEGIKESASGFVEGAKGALLAKVPGFVMSTAKLIGDVKKEVEESNKNNEKGVEEQKKTNQYLGDSNKWMKKLADDMRAMREKTSQADKFAEETAMEKKYLDEKMLSTMKDIRDALVGATGGGKGAPGAPSDEGDTTIIGAFGAGGLLKKAGRLALLLARNPYVLAAAGIFAGVKLAAASIPAMPGSPAAAGQGPGRPSGGQNSKEFQTYINTISTTSGISVEELQKKSFSEFTADQQTKIIEGMKKAEGGKEGQRNVRNNNPGNITIPSVRNAEGKLEPSDSGKKWLEVLKKYDGEAAPYKEGDPFIYAKFAKEENGIAAAKAMLMGDISSAYKNMPLWDQMATWTGSSAPKQSNLAATKLTANQTKRQESTKTREELENKVNELTVLDREGKLSQEQRIELFNLRRQLDVAKATEQTVHLQTSAEDTINKNRQIAEETKKQSNRKALAESKLIEKLRQGKYRQPGDMSLVGIFRDKGTVKEEEKRDRELVEKNATETTQRKLKLATSIETARMLEANGIFVPDQATLDKEKKDKETAAQTQRARESQKALASKQTDIFNAIKNNTGATARGVKAIVETRVGPYGLYTPTPEEKARRDAAKRDYYTRRYQGLIDTAGNITKNLINTELTKLFFPKGQAGVGKDQSQMAGYLAGVAGNKLQLGKRSTQFLSSIFGKKVGTAFGGVTGQALGLGIEQFAGAAGKQFGFGDPEKMPFFMEQILGNFAGNKEQRKLAREQLIYNLTGVPTGSTSLIYAAQKFIPGLSSFELIDPNTGKIKFDKVGEAGGKFISQGLKSLFGFPEKPGATPTPATVTKINPETGETYQALAEPGTAPTAQQGIFGGFFDNLFGRRSSGATIPNPPKPMTAIEQNKFLDANTEVPQQLETTNSTLADQSSRKDDQGFFGGMIDSISGLGNSILRIFTGFGGGTGGMGGGGGGMGGGGGAAGTGGGGFLDNFLSGLSNVGMNLAGMYGGYKITKAMGIKNPMAQMVTSMLINQGIQYGLKNYVLPYVGSFISSTFPGFAGSVASNFPALAATFNLTGMAPTFVPATTAMAGDAAFLAANGVYQTGAAGAAAAGGGSAAAGTALVGEEAIAAATAAEAAAGSSMLASAGAFLTNPYTLIAIAAIAAIASVSRGGTPHEAGYSLTSKSGNFDRTWKPGGERERSDYQQVTDKLALSIKSTLNNYAIKVKSKSRFEVGVAIASDGEDPSYWLLQIYKDGTKIYDSGQKWELPADFGQAVQMFIDMKIAVPMRDAMMSLDLTEAQKTDVSTITEYTTGAQVQSYVAGGSKDANLLKPTYEDVFKNRAAVTYSGGGGESGVGSDSTQIYSMQQGKWVDWTGGGDVVGLDEFGNPVTQAELKNKVGTKTKATYADVLKYRPVIMTPESYGQEGEYSPAQQQVYSMQDQRYIPIAIDPTVLGYDENGNPIRSADLSKPVGSGAGGTASPSSTVATGTATAATTSTTGGTATSATTTGNAATVTASTGTPVTDYYNNAQQALNNTIDNLAATAATGGGSVVAATNVVDNSVKTNNTIINTDTRNTDPILYTARRGPSYVEP